MSPAAESELEANVARASSFALASLLVAYPEHDFQERLRLLLDGGALEAARAPEQRDLLRSLLVSTNLDELRSEHIEVFERAAAFNPLYETEYGRMRAVGKGHTLADIAGFYQAFGVRHTDGTFREAPDHLAVELEFYALLLVKEAHLAAHGEREGVEIVRAARRSFLEAHLGAFAPAAAARVQHPRYSPILELVRRLVAAECASFGLEPAPLEADGVAAAAEDDAEHAACGALGRNALPVIQ